MRNEIFNSMKVNKQQFIEKIKSGENPNRLKNEVEEKLNEIEKIVETAEMPLLPIERVYNEKNEEEIVMKNIGIVRRTGFIQRFRKTYLNRENFLMKLYAWFEMPLSVIE